MCNHADRNTWRCPTSFLPADRIRVPPSIISTNLCSVLYSRFLILAKARWNSRSSRCTAVDGNGGRNLIEERCKMFKHAT